MKKELGKAVAHYLDFNAAEKVHDLDTFISFLEALFVDWEEAVAAEKRDPSSPYSSMHGWENTSIGTFLNAAVAGARDNNLEKPGGLHADENAWRQAAAIILLGKLYE